VSESCTAHQKLNLNSDTILYRLRQFSRLAGWSHIKAKETSLEALMRSGLQYADRFWRMLPIPLCSSPVPTCWYSTISSSSKKVCTKLQNSLLEACGPNLCCQSSQSNTFP